MKYRIWLFIGFASCQGCPSNSMPDGGLTAGLQTITVSPATSTLTIDGASATLQLMVTGTYMNGSTLDITDDVTYSVAPLGIGTVSATGLFTSGTTQGGVGTITAQLGGVTGTATVTLTLKKTFNDPASMNLPADPGSKFGGTASTANAPELVYPNDGVLLPPNLGRLEFHFRPGAGNTLFELGLTNAITDVKIYLRCTTLGAGCSYQPAADVWAALAETNRGGTEVTATLRATDDNGTQVSTSNATKISFAYDDLQGGIYYWTTTSRSIQRYDFASSTQTMPEKYISAAEITMPGQTTNCIGCHALTREGTKMIVQSGGQFDGRLAVLTVATRGLIAPFGSTQISTFESWNQDGTKFVGVYSDVPSGAYVNNNKRGLMLFDGATAAYLSEIAGTGTTANPANHPDWSPDGSKIVYARAGIYNYGSNAGGGVNGGTLQFMGQGYLEVVSTSDVGATWSAPVQITAPDATKNRYYPAFAPDSSFIVFNQAQNTGSDDDSDTNTRSKLFAARPEAGATLVELAKAALPGRADGATVDFVNSYPKWAPFVFQRARGELASRLMWLTFASRRQYGLRSPTGSSTLLWMVAVDPDKVALGQDPSYTAFCLPFQDLATSNHIAQWATKVVEAPPIN